MDEIVEYKASNVCAMSELGHVLAVIGELDVPVMVLKGACLLETVYANSFTRPMCDLDILVHEEDLGKVYRKLEESGYRQESHNWGNHITFVRENSPFAVPVELHWELFNSKNPFHKYALKIKADDVWRDAVPLAVKGQKALMMGPEHLLIYHSLHLVNEYYANEKWILDIDRITRYYGDRLKWDFLVAESRRLGVGKALWFALNSARARYDTTLPSEFFDKLVPEGMAGWELRLSVRLNMARPLSRPALLALYFSLMDGNAQRIRSLCEYIPFCLMRPFMLKRKWIGVTSATNLQ